uniref:Uncharacterized protein n=1 Tax=Amphimedon queenslandica TaxID=400682 RepID=A0A1X7UM61_AMPQE
MASPENSYWPPPGSCLSVTLMPLG